MYLFFHLKKSQGNLDGDIVTSPDEDVVTSPSSPHPLTQSLSINGELVETIDLDDINIHDFATFEKEQILSPDFKASIRRRGNNVGENENEDRKMSFVDAAKHVQIAKSVLNRWPKRPRSRHHSSSSEDIVEDSESEEIKTTVNNNVPISDDCLSAGTTESELSHSSEVSESPEKINTNLGTGLTNIKHESIETTEHEHVSKSSPSTENSTLMGKEKKRKSRNCPCVVL